MVAVYKRTEVFCASVIFSSLCLKATCACLSSSLTRRFSWAFNVRFRVRRLSEYASISAACFRCRVIRLSLNSCSSWADGSICTVFLPPKKPVMPFFFCCTVRTRVARFATSGKWFIRRLSASSCRSNTDMMCRRCSSLLCNMERKVSTCVCCTKSLQ